MGHSALNPVVAVSVLTSTLTVEIGAIGVVALLITPRLAQPVKL